MGAQANSIAYLQGKSWWSYLLNTQRDLLMQSLFLIEREEKTRLKFDDYSFLVFPAAKAYEGFLKKFFYDLGLITKHEYEGSHFRIGRALNPSLPEKFRDRDWVYGELGTMCGGYALPRHLWETWRESRNLLFHWFPKKTSAITLKEAQEKVSLIVGAIDKAFEDCLIQQGARSKRKVWGRL